MQITNVEEFLDSHKSVSQESEKLFVSEFLTPIIGVENLDNLIPQYPFMDSEGVKRRIDFVLVGNRHKLAIEIDGETYHAEGAISSRAFDDSLNRQNDILGAGFQLLRFSYTQLQDPIQRQRVSRTLYSCIIKYLPELLTGSANEPNEIQKKALAQIKLRREQGWNKGIVILPTGTGKTFLSAFDSQEFKGRILFVVHRLDILKQNKEAYETIYPKENIGLLTGEVQEDIDARILFASKDTLRNRLSDFEEDTFEYIVIDEVHHSEAETYKSILYYFKPSFMLGLTATPDRMDRKDIFELFDYQKIYEYSLNQAITDGYIVPYNYYGLKDNIDYSKIKYNGQKYDVKDLDKHLIIPQRNQRILEEYLEKGQGNKAIGFCCSVNHAEAMACFFSSRGVPSIAITSKSEEDKSELISQFRDNKYDVAFTVDLFNEGVDFPDVRVLLFLRPTESKTVFLQQLGRGLRLCGSKDSVTVLDFIGNYKKANFIRSILSEGQRTEARNEKTKAFEKFVYVYNPKCTVQFDAEVEQILDEQDESNREVTKDDLIAAYYELAETLGRKPSKQDITNQGRYSVSQYIKVFGGWIGFLREIGEATEASFHFPQGVHLGHIFYILKILRSGDRTGTHIDDKYVKLRGGFTAGIDKFQRQTKYKLQALMELGLIKDDRKLGNDVDFLPELTPLGKEFSDAISPLFESIDYSFKDKGDRVTWEMVTSPEEFNERLRYFISTRPNEEKIVKKVFYSMKAVGLMLNYLYRFERKRVVTKSSIYEHFFEFDFVKTYCEYLGIDTATQTGAEHRCPFLINILASLGVVTINRSSIELKKFVVNKSTMNLENYQEDDAIIQRRISIFATTKAFDDNELVLLKETFGKEFLTNDYYLSLFDIIDYA